MPAIDEIAPDVFRISLYEPALDMQFNHFLVRDDAPLLFHTGYRRAFETLREAVATLIDPADLRWVGWSHFESDECGALNDWLRVARTPSRCARSSGRWSTSTTSRSAPPAGWAGTTWSTPAATGSGTWPRRTCRTGGTRA